MTWSRLLRDQWVKWSRWEFWPSWLFNIPVVLIWIYYGIRSFNFFFFTRANPVIESGGLLGESKINIYRHLPAGVCPKTVFIPAAQQEPSAILDQVTSAGIPWPAIVKPNMGERGFLVRKCADEDEMLHHLQKHRGTDFLVQEYIAWEEEYSVMYHRFPDAETGVITSLCKKGFLHTTGDGVSTIETLIMNDPRASFQLDRFRVEKPELLSRIPDPGQRILLEPIGNHCKGTTFLDANYRITPELTSVFDRISRESTDLYYGRFDLRCRSLEDLEKGVHFSILEYNGVASEPAHIYHPGRSLWKAYRDIARHWNILYRLCEVQKKRGVPAESASNVWRQFRNWWRYKEGGGVKELRS